MTSNRKPLPFVSWIILGIPLQIPLLRLVKRFGGNRVKLGQITVYVHLMVPEQMNPPLNERDGSDFCKLASAIILW